MTTSATAIDASTAATVADTSPLGVFWDIDNCPVSHSVLMLEVTYTVRHSRVCVENHDWSFITNKKSDNVFGSSEKRIPRSHAPNEEKSKKTTRRGKIKRENSDLLACLLLLLLLFSSHTPRTPPPLLSSPFLTRKNKQPHSRPFFIVIGVSCSGTERSRSRNRPRHGDGGAACQRSSRHRQGHQRAR